MIRGQVRAVIRQCVLLVLMIVAAPGDTQSLQGLSVDEVRARAEAGDPAAQNQLMTQAPVWYERAAEQGHHIGQFNTGIAYELGDGAEKDSGTAYLWFFLAAWTGTPDQAAQKLYERKRDELKAQLSDSALAEASERILRYQQRFSAR